MQHRTVAKESHGFLEDRKSRFFAHLVPILLFDRTLADLKTEHRKANHHVTAFRHLQEDGRVIESAKDDGEPAGTSGMPVLKVLQGRQLVDVGAIVVRYFGGIKLGGGGLARAYSGAVAQAIETADLVPWQRIVRKTLSCPFSEMSAVETKIGALMLTVVDRRFSETGQTLIVEGPEDRMKQLIRSAG